MQTAIDQIIQSPRSYALLEFDAACFANSSTISTEQRTEIVASLAKTFCTDSNQRQFVAGVILNDLLAYSWARLGLGDQVIDVSFEELTF